MSAGDFYEASSREEWSRRPPLTSGGGVVKPRDVDAVDVLHGVLLWSLGGRRCYRTRHMSGAMGGRGARGLMVEVSRVDDGVPGSRESTRRWPGERPSRRLLTSSLLNNPPGNGLDRAGRDRQDSDYCRGHSVHSRNKC